LIIDISLITSPLLHYFFIFIDYYNFFHFHCIYFSDIDIDFIDGFMPLFHWLQPLFSCHARPAFAA